jgi:hypothetical protein
MKQRQSEWTLAYVIRKDDSVEGFEPDGIQLSARDSRNSDVIQKAQHLPAPFPSYPTCPRQVMLLYVLQLSKSLVVDKITE